MATSLLVARPTEAGRVVWVLTAVLTRIAISSATSPGSCTNQCVSSTYASSTLIFSMGPNCASTPITSRELARMRGQSAGTILSVGQRRTAVVVGIADRIPNCRAA